MLLLLAPNRCPRRRLSTVGSMRRFTPLDIWTCEFVVVVPAEVPANTLSELALHRSNLDKLNYAVLPNSNMQLDHAAVRSGHEGAGSDGSPVHGVAPMATALLINQVQRLGFSSVSALPHIQSGKLKALAVTSKNRWPRLPQVPSMGELGIDFESGFLGSESPHLPELRKRSSTASRESSSPSTNCLRCARPSSSSVWTRSNRQLRRWRRRSSANAPRLADDELARAGTRWGKRRRKAALLFRKRRPLRVKTERKQLRPHSRRKQMSAS